MNTVGTDLLRTKPRTFQRTMVRTAAEPSLYLDFTASNQLDPRIDFTRASTATYFDKDGVLQSAAAGEARFDYNPSTLAPRGLPIEDARTNHVLHSRDLTNVAWTATNITPAKNQTGIDGVANSASLITATAANGTILQTVTTTSTRILSAYVKRVTGTGAIEITRDNGTTWTAVTVTSAWTRVNIASASVTNPVIGFRIVTSGDAIAVDGVQLENGAFITSVIFTTDTALTRSAEVALITGTNFSSWYNQSEGTLFAECVPFSESSAFARVASIAGTSTVLSIQRNGNLARGFGDEASTSSSAMLQNVVSKVALAGKINDFALSANNGVPNVDTSTNALLTATSLLIGSTAAGTSHLNGYFLRVAYFPIRLPNAQLRALTI
jgi:hypothetical protein